MNKQFKRFTCVASWENDKVPRLWLKPWLSPAFLYFYIFPNSFEFISLQITGLEVPVVVNYHKCFLHYNVPTNNQIKTYMVVHEPKTLVDQQKQQTDDISVGPNQNVNLTFMLPLIPLLLSEKPKASSVCRFTSLHSLPEHSLVSGRNCTDADRYDVKQQVYFLPEAFQTSLSNVTNA